MKFLPKLFLFVLLTNAAIAQSKEERAVAEAVNHLNASMVALDAPALEKMTSPLLTYGHSDGRIEDKAAYIENVVKGPTIFKKINTDGQWIRISGKTATVRHILNAQTDTGGEVKTIQLKVLLVWVKEKGEWLLLARQAVK